MKKNDRKVKTLQLNRETLVRLSAGDLSNAVGGAAAEKCTGCDSGCGIIYDPTL